ncbi:MAG: HAMP domain-containing histidine kinase [Inquilinus sp.]|nr:HAMP domain-containing histidine kinase [Inquilinus sp.]
MPWFLRSLAIRLVVLVVVFLTVPILIYDQFRAADREKSALLLRDAQLQGELIARSLTQVLQEANTAVPAAIVEDLSQFIDSDARVRLLLRRANVPGAHGFYFVASAPPIPSAHLDREREELLSQGILGRLAQTCSGNLPLAMRVSVGDGPQEVLTSITPVNTEFGCWAIVTSHDSEVIIGSSIGRPYWSTPEVRVAALIYAAMALLVLALFLGVWRNLHRFGELARQIGNDPVNAMSFAAQNTQPELQSVAQDFDRLVESLHSSADRIRRAAEDNAHAFKTPIGVIRQSVEPLKRLVPANSRGVRAIDMIEQSLHRLDSLVSVAQHIEDATADLLEPPWRIVDLSDLVRRMLGGYSGLDIRLRPQFVLQVDNRVAVRANEDLLETIIENLVDNAVSFSPPEGRIDVGVHRRGKLAELTIEDSGPGVDPSSLDRIFERYVSERPEANGDDEGPRDSGAHFGIGLWIVRQNVEAVGGEVFAENRSSGGLRVKVSLPSAA